MSSKARARTRRAAALWTIAQGAALGLHRASLDAPLVALLWYEILAETLAHEPLRGAQKLLLPLGVWLAYAGDRIVDVWLARRRGRARASERHAFVERHFKALCATWLALAGAALLGGLRLLEGASLVAATWTVLGIGAYLASCQLLPVLRKALPRELVVGLVFAWGTSVFLAPFAQAEGAGAELRLRHWLPATLSFAVLCVWNCVLVSWLERRRDAQSAQLSLASGGRLTRAGFEKFAIASLWVALLLAYVAVLGPTRAPGMRAAACALFLISPVLVAVALRGLELRAAKLEDPARLAPYCDFALLVPAPLYWIFA